MENKIEIDLYDDLKAVCNQARDELCIAYNYFKQISDYNGVYILFNEIYYFDIFFELDSFNPRISNDIKQKQNIREHGVCDRLTYEIAILKTDDAVQTAVAQKIIGTKQKLYMPNGSFYGYYCYNIYNKCLSWINFSLKKFGINPAFCQNIVTYFERAMQYFMRYEG